MSSEPSPSPAELQRQPETSPSDAPDHLLPLVYAELRRMADRRIRGHQLTIGPTSLVHEAWLKLARSEGLQVSSRAHFLGIAATAMRQIVVDRARAHLADKRGAGQAAEPLSDDSGFNDARAEEAVALDDALARLDALDPRLRRVVECRFFGGLTEEETAATIGVTSRTVRSDWVKARALLAGWLRS